MLTCSLRSPATKLRIQYANTVCHDLTSLLQHAKN